MERILDVVRDRPFETVLERVFEAMGHPRIEPRLIDVPEADRIIARYGGAAQIVDCPLASANGRVLREDIRTDRAQPPYHRITMDGFALSSAALTTDRRTFRRQAVQAAGAAPTTLEGADNCIEVMTGAVLPDGCDTVIRSEDAVVSGDLVTLRPGVAARPLQYVHAKGSDAAAGAVVVASGSRLSPARIGIAASMGLATLKVSRLPQVAIVTTGNELVALDAEPSPYQVRRSNGYAIRAALLAHGYGDPALCHLADDRKLLTRELAGLLERCDVLILTGGVSKGKFDFVPDVLSELGVEAHFHRVKQRPGKPLWFGTRQDRAVFGLPGNPVSALTCTRRYVLPYLGRISGERASQPPRVPLGRAATGLAGLTRFLHVSLDPHDGAAVPVETNTSGDFLALGRSDGFVEIPESAGEVAAGSELPYYSWNGDGRC